MARHPNTASNLAAALGVTDQHNVVKVVLTISANEIPTLTVTRMVFDELDPDRIQEAISTTEIETKFQTTGPDGKLL